MHCRHDKHRQKCYEILFLIVTNTIFQFVFVLILQSQSSLPVIKAYSKSVDIREGAILYKNKWDIVPEYKPDIYTSSLKDSLITFITDVDSISFVLKSNVYNRFVILLNDKDSALTELRYALGNLEILQRAYKYNNDDKRTVPAFTYQSEKNWH